MGWGQGDEPKKENLRVKLMKIRQAHYDMLVGIREIAHNEKRGVLTQVVNKFETICDELEYHLNR